MKNFLLITNPLKEKSKENAELIVEILRRNGCNCTAALFPRENPNGGNYLYTNPDKVPQDTEAVITLGGDGTFIHALKDLISLNLPVFGVNFGTLGYLTEVEVSGFEGALQAVCRGEYEIENRMMMSYRIYHESIMSHEGLVLNDIAINRSLDTGIAELYVAVDGHFLNSYSADGIILSTPTGSTGYNLSAGGPLVLPTAQVILVTPICAHTLNSRSIVLPADVEVEIISRARSRERARLDFVTIDGEKGIRLASGDVVKACKAEVTSKIIRVNKAGFIKNLRREMR
ncbi:MAG: NAD(+)/NADH kinase [Lachnospiraceae bacterium]|jgi:NAD+ kinase